MKKIIVVLLTVSVGCQGMESGDAPVAQPKELAMVDAVAVNKPEKSAIERLKEKMCMQRATNDAVTSYERKCGQPGHCIAPESKCYQLCLQCDSHDCRECMGQACCACMPLICAGILAGGIVLCFACRP